MHEDEAVGAWTSTTDNLSSSFHPGYYEVWRSQSMYHQNLRKLTSFFRETFSLKWFSQLRCLVLGTIHHVKANFSSLPSPPVPSSPLPSPSPPLDLLHTPSFSHHIIYKREGCMWITVFKRVFVDLLRKQQKWIACMELLKLLRSFVFQRLFKCVSSLVNSLRILTSNFHKMLLRIISFIFFSFLKIHFICGKEGQRLCIFK